MGGGVEVGGMEWNLAGRCPDRFWCLACDFPF